MLSLNHKTERQTKGDTVSADYHLQGVNNPTDPVAATTGFQRKTIFLFLLALGLVMGVCAVMINQAGSDAARQQLVDSLTAGLPAAQAPRLDTSAVQQVLRDFQYRLGAAAAVFFAALLGVMLIAVRKVAKPIDELGHSAELIAGGQLEGIPPTPAYAEITKIATLINDLAMNLQEILLLTWNHTGEHREGLERLSDVLKQPGNGAMVADCRAEVDVLRRQVEEMRKMVKAFDLYDVRISDTAVLTAMDGEAAAAP